MQNPCKYRLFFTFKTAIEAFRKYLMMQAIFVGFAVIYANRVYCIHRYSRSRLLIHSIITMRKRDLYDKSKMAREPGKKL